MSGSPGRCFCRRWNLDDASIAASREAFTSDCTNDLIVDVTTFELPHSRHWPPAAWVSIGQMKRLPEIDCRGYCASRWKPSWQTKWGARMRVHLCSREAAMTVPPGRVPGTSPTQLWARLSRAICAPSFAISASFKVPRWFSETSLSFLASAGDMLSECSCDGIQPRDSKAMDTHM